jgi:hypothetical protein
MDGFRLQTYFRVELKEISYSTGQSYKPVAVDIVVK